MKPDDFRRILRRDVEALIRQIEAYPDERELWTRPGGVGNSPANLALHIAGNLRHFIGRGLGGQDYVRDRSAEFSTADVSRAELVQGLRVAADLVDLALERLRDEWLDTAYPEPVGDVELPTGRFLLHLCTHLSYHLGQIDAHRRITTGQGALGKMQDRDALAD